MDCTHCSVVGRFSVHPEQNRLSPPGEDDTAGETDREGRPVVEGHSCIRHRHKGNKPRIVTETHTQPLVHNTLQDSSTPGGLHRGGLTHVRHQVHTYVHAEVQTAHALGVLVEVLLCTLY